MKDKIYQVVIIVIAVSAILLAAQYILPARSLSWQRTLHAQEIVSGNLYVINQDSFVLTTSSSGSDVYVYYFDANPEIDKSTIRFVIKASAR